MEEPGLRRERVDGAASGRDDWSIRAEDRPGAMVVVVVKERSAGVSGRMHVGSVLLRYQCCCCCCLADRTSDPCNPA